MIAALPSSLQEDVGETLKLESEPITILLQQSAYDEMVLRQRINEACRATMLAFAKGYDLDHIGVTRGVARLVIREADLSVNPPIEEVLENDEDYRRRVQLAPEGYSCAGPYSAYMFYALSSDSKVKDVSITRLSPGVVGVYLLSSDGNGTADALLVEKVSDVLNAEDIRPLNDTVVVKSVTVLNYSINATLSFYPSVHKDVSLLEANKSLEGYVSKSHRNGIDITVAGIIHALKVEGVQNVKLTEPLADIVVSPEEAAYCTDIRIVDGGVNV